MLIRRERAVDIDAIAAVHRSAFAPHYTEGGPAAGIADPANPPEVELVARLRSDPAWIPTLSMVAVEHDQIIGHVCLTRAAVGPFPVLALGPIGVLAERQKYGIGSALMHAAIGAADALDEPLIGLLGSLEYYPRFGFVPGVRVGITPDEPSWVTHFQVRELTAYDPQIIGEFRYADLFY
ncbi:GNAT family N-acetyltransferase [Nocardia donostiensis]|uniref:GNAT family N-acetyltransferase n=1 Tax=Nocardia donostiensis TaxID=1538463 RepID=A0A1W0AXX6_9NOCA|nr:N-acetyltransferase [Nocardia donostiensis]ONM47550.1 GNAT family N-acetyltransferase [Nocardia donostiensis]OQS15107.1 GNAT family N-acetyltransferase [Nocardia donostiensis]OQS24280.1 GNAT family N-acetyltransferase [Nocardia donostiensis]